jgi:TPR repeat protein
MISARFVAFALVILAIAAAACGMGEDEAPADLGARTPAVADARVGVGVDCGPDPIAAWVATGPGPDLAAAERDVDERWLPRKRCLAEDGDADAQLTLGIAYRDGSDGPPQDFVQAAAWFARAAEQGHPMAQFNLGRFHEHGRGVGQERGLVSPWFPPPCAPFPWPGDMRLEAFSHRDRLGKRLTEEDLREAQRLATEWWENRSGHTTGSP